MYWELVSVVSISDIESNAIAAENRRREIAKRAVLRIAKRQVD